MTNYKVEYGLGEKVYLKLREDRTPGLITGIAINPGCVCYFISWPDTRAETRHYELELCRDFEPEWSTP